jgi:hypothetical protein
MENVVITLNANAYNHLVSLLADLPNRSNSYGILMEIERQAKEQMDAFEAAEKESAEVTEKADED